MKKVRKVYQIRGSGAAGFGQGFEMWKSETRYGSGSAAIDVCASMPMEEHVVDFMTLPVDRIDEFIEALTTLRDEIVAEEMSEAEV